MKVAIPWDELPVQEQLNYENMVLRVYPNLSLKELEEKAKKLYESMKNPASKYK